MVICKVLAGFIRVGVGAVVILLITYWLLTYWRVWFWGRFLVLGRGLTQSLRLCRGCRGDVLGPRFDWNTLNVRLACYGWS